ncbi:PH and SEC7 domain-containing protein isoform X4 [Drosophila kikkawai]|uniref:PH and SEC7 domain-containing protein isoform X4 n=1 Tax=Drosophila kikkawai TaxID=30033 RepID=A0ABM4GLG2_DROKI
MTEELKVVLRRSEQHSGFGFSLLGTTGPPHVIYDIVENSPAADCGAVEAGDVILKVNGTDVHRYTTKEVLKCLRLSEQLVTLELKRDPKLKARIKEQLANTQSPHYVDIESPNIYDYHSSSPHSSPNHRPAAGAKGTATTPTPTQSGLRYKSPTHLPSLRQNSSPLLASGSTTTTTTASHTLTHSRNSSASSTKIKVVETSITTSTTSSTTGIVGPTSPTGGEATSPTFRPSRIPQALKCPAPKPVPLLHSPQNKRPRPSQIPTKAANGNGNGIGHSSQLPPQALQHSNSYSGSPVTRQRFSTEREQEREPEPNSAPPQPAKAPRFEAYMMTGDLILNLSRTPQTSNLLPAQAKKVDSLRDSPSRLVNPRINGALAPRASGESSPTSSSSVDSPTNTSSDSVKREAKVLRKQQQQQPEQHQQQQQRDSINNSYNRKDSLTNDTLLMCEELERDEEAEYGQDEDNRQQRQRQQQQQQRYRQQQNQQRYEYYQNDDELEEQEEVEEREEDQTHYDITNIETYQSGLGRGDEDDSDRQCLVDDDDDDDAYDDEENDAGDEDYSTNSLGSGSAKQRLRALKQRTATRQQQRHRDAVDCAGRSGSGSSSTTVKSEAGGLGLDETSFSVPTSPISLSTPLIDKETANSVPTSPEPSSVAGQESGSGAGAGAGAVVVRRHNGHVVRKCDAAGFRTSKSEDHLQQIQREGIAAVIPIDIDEDVNSSLNTLLDTRQDSEDSQASDRDRIVWTYNAPLQPHQLAALQRQQQVQEQQFQQHQQQLQQQHQQHLQQQQLQQQNQQQQQTFYGGMVLSDPSDSDSTILVSDAAALQRQQLKQQLRAQQQQQRERERERDRDREQSEHKVVIQVRGLDSSNSSNGGRSEEDVITLTDEPLGTTSIGLRDGSPPVSDDGSDVESLHSYHYSPKAVDMPSAIRLAKRLHSLDGFKKSDVSRHLSKNNDFSRAVADEYLKYFTFEKKSLDQALREFLQQFSLSGETQERERVLVHFSKRFLDCNPGTFNSQDAVHTLTCAIMLLNTDLHGANINRKMSCAEFVDNLADLNDGENFPKDVLKFLYQAIKTKPLEWALDEDSAELQQQQRANNSALGNVGQNPFLDPPELATAVEYKKGYVMRKCCYDSSSKKTPFGKRSWKMFYCTLRDLVLYLHKDEHGFRKSQMSDNLHNAIRIHHALATKANDYTKKQHVFRLQTADQAEYLFQTSDSKELQSWVETINYVCAAISAPPLEGGVGSQKRFQRPLLPSKQSKLMLKEQLESHELQLAQLEQELNEHKKGPIPSKGLPLQNYKEKESYLQYEIRRYRTYVSILSAKLLADQQQLELQATQPAQAAAHDEEADTFPVGNTTACPPSTPQSISLQQPKEQQQQQQQAPPTNRAPRISGTTNICWNYLFRDSVCCCVLLCFWHYCTVSTIII